jgi:hypothetical protein
MEILHDELRFLQEHGEVIYDAASGTSFNCHAHLLTAISDYRGLEAFLSVGGSPAKYACFK